MGGFRSSNAKTVGECRDHAAIAPGRESSGATVLHRVEGACSDEFASEFGVRVLGKHAESDVVRVGEAFERHMTRLGVEAMRAVVRRGTGADVHRRADEMLPLYREHVVTVLRIRLADEREVAIDRCCRR